MQENLKIELTIGGFRSILELDAELLAEGRRQELGQKLGLVPSAVEHLARRAGLRPAQDAELEAVIAFNRAHEAGDTVEAERLLSVLLEPYLKA